MSTIDLAAKRNTRAMLTRSRYAWTVAEALYRAYLMDWDADLAELRPHQQMRYHQMAEAAIATLLEEKLR